MSNLPPHPFSQLTQQKKIVWELKILTHFSCGRPYLDYHSTRGSRSVADGSFISQAGWVKGCLWPGVPSSRMSPAALHQARAHSPGQGTKDPAASSQRTRAADERFLSAPSSHLQGCFTSDSLHPFSLPPSLATKPGWVTWGVCGRAGWFACRWELSGSVSLRVREPSPLLPPPTTVTQAWP